MAMNNCQLKGVKVDENKNYITKKYISGTNIHILAKEFNVGTDTLCRRLKKWGVKIKKGDFKKKKTAVRQHWKRNFSKKFLEARAIRTQKYGDKVTHIKIKGKPHDERLIHNILI